MATRTDLNMLQNINRKLRTGLWQVPVQWKALRRVPGWSYTNADPVPKLQVPHQKLYPLIFQRLPILRLEGHRLGELPTTSTGTSTGMKSLTQRMVLRWWQLYQTKQYPTLPAAFEQVKLEFEPHLQQFAQYLQTTKKESQSRLAQLAAMKIKKDELDRELGRAERYAERLEHLVNRAIGNRATDPNQYFSPTVSRKLIRLITNEKKRELSAEKTTAFRETLETTTLAKRSEAIVTGITTDGNQAIPVPAVADLQKASPDGSVVLSQPAPEGKHYRNPIAAFPTDAKGEPIPTPELYYQLEKSWTTNFPRVPRRIRFGESKRLGGPARLGEIKDRRMTEFTRCMDDMQADEDATLADYLAYVLQTQILTLQKKRLDSWLPYTSYLNSKIFFHAFRLLQTGIKSSSVVIPNGYPILPKVRHYKLQSHQWTFQQSVTHQRLLILIQNHLTVTDLNSNACSRDLVDDRDVDADKKKKRKLPLTPFWREVYDEKVRIRHPGESWYNARLFEMIKFETYEQEYERLEQEVKQKWLAERAKKAAAVAATPATETTTQTPTAPTPTQ